MTSIGDWAIPDTAYVPNGQVPELAKSHNTESVPTPNKGNLRATGESKIVKNPQPTELQELIDMILAENQKTERGGFEPPVL